MDINEIIDVLKELEHLKILAAQELSRFFSINASDIYYCYMSNAIPMQGITNTGVSFVFHGFECSVKTSDWEVELEFGPAGEVKGFDKYRVCHILGYEMHSCHDLIRMLEDNGVIKLIDADLSEYSLSSDLKQYIANMPFKKQMDLNVADRYILAI